MLFNSLEFAIFFPVVCVCYFALGRRGQTNLLLVASCVFYMAFVPAYILILGVTIVIDYFAGMWLETARGRDRKVLLVVSVVATCLVLFIFKYYAFFTGSFVGLAGLLGWKVSPPMLEIILPIGLSFHTFQSLSYVVEVYRGHHKAERNFAAYATYVMFFPQLVAGPIERPQNLLDQFAIRHGFDYAGVTSGLKRMAWGFFKKLVVADRLSLYVGDVYANPQAHNGLQLTIATVFFAYQIYCDFSGYSDIAIGTARVLGFKLMENFNTPYASTSISEFWRRWHISLSTWFRDYLYFPLGGSRVGPLKHTRNILLTFGVSGLWHGANWTYVIWGLQNGLYLIFGWLTQPFRSRVYAAAGLPERHPLRLFVGITCTFALTCAAWVIFRAHSLGDAWHIYTHLHLDWDWSRITTQQFSLKHFVPALAAIVTLELVQFAGRRLNLAEWVSTLAFPVRWSFYLVAVYVIILFGVFRSHSFIYFQF
ncbi:MAG: MBOAT family O-acyltransferase [Opitutaceae bacterium]|nr:MBOAT family O-acyltransferase [Opitutaceae bacterium]